MSFFDELKRRNVFKVATLYIVVGWLILQVGDILVPLLDLSESVLKIVFLLLVLGFPPAVIFSWVFELTPEGIRREKDVDRSRSIATETGRKLNYTTVVLLLVAIGLLLFNRFMPADPAGFGPGITTTSTPGETPATDSAQGAGGPTSVAVLPFVNMSTDEENEFFSDGISEELLNVLVRIEGLRVPSRTSSFAFKGREDMSIRDIADELEVDHILEGSVRKAGNKVRITAQLIDVRTDAHLWSETYDRELEDIFAIQDEIATRIVDALEATLGAGASSPVVTGHQPTDDMEAYQLYLQGRYLWRQRGPQNIRESIELLNKAVELDPDYAEAWGALAVANLTLPYYAGDASRSTDPAGKAAAERALALDPDLGEAWAALANATAHTGDYVRALELHRQGVEVAPKDSTGRLWYGLTLGELGYLQEAMEQLEIGHQLDPASGIHNHWLGMAYYMDGREKEALALFDRGVALGRGPAMWGTVEHLLIEERLGEAVDLMLANPEIFSLPREILDTAAGLEHPEKTDWFVEQMIEVGRSAFVFLAVRGDHERALEDLERIARFDDTAYYVMWHPMFSPMRQSPFFADFAERTVLAGVWRERGWPDLCRPVGDSFECD